MLWFFNPSPFSFSSLDLGCVKQKCKILKVPQEYWVVAVVVVLRMNLTVGYDVQKYSAPSRQILSLNIYDCGLWPQKHYPTCAINLLFVSPLSVSIMGENNCISIKALNIISFCRIWSLKQIKDHFIIASFNMIGVQANWKKDTRYR